MKQIISLSFKVERHIPATTSPASACPHGELTVLMEITTGQSLVIAGKVGQLGRTIQFNSESL